MDRDCPKWRLFLCCGKDTKSRWEQEAEVFTEEEQERFFEVVHILVLARTELMFAVARMAWLGHKGYSISPQHCQGGRKGVFQGEGVPSGWGAVSSKQFYLSTLFFIICASNYPLQPSARRGEEVSERHMVWRVSVWALNWEVPFLMRDSTSKIWVDYHIYEYIAMAICRNDQKMDHKPLPIFRVHGKMR